MLQRRLSPARQRRYLRALLATGLACAVPFASSAEESITPSVELVAPSAAPTASPAELELTPPINSTLEIRIARRPWLFEKLTKPTVEPSIKMNPPRPPALPDPPSISERKPVSDDGWIGRDSERQDSGQQDSELAAREAAREAPLRSDRIDSGGTENERSLRRLQSEHSKASPDQPPAADQDAEAVDLQPLRDPAGPRSSDTPAEKTDEAIAHVSDDLEAFDNEGSDFAPEVEEVTIRDLLIDPDGQPNQATSSSQRGGSLSADAESAAADQNAEAPDSVPPDTDVVADGAAEAREPKLDYTGYPLAPLRLTNSVYRMRNSMNQCLRYYYGRPEVANERSNWGMLHSIMVYGIDTKILVGNRSYSAIAWIAGNNACRGQKLLTEENGRIAVSSGVGLQGHQGQMLAVFSMCSVPEDYPLYAGSTKYSVRDVVESEMLACKSGAELTFTLIGLAHYLDTDAVWRSADGQHWDFERLIREELSQPIVGAACGGTHRLMGFAHALRKRRAEGRPITGQWKRAEMFSADFVQYTYRLQNRDGSFSTDWFEGQEDNGDLDRKIQTTGHIVEWLLTLTPDSQLQNPRLVSAVQYLLTALYNERNHDWSIGPKGHALRSLAMYYERVYQSGPAWRTPTVASSTTPSRQ